MSHFQFSLKDFDYPIKTEGLKIGIVYTFWNNDITNLLKNAAEEVLKRAGVLADQIQLMQVPGAVEIPLAAQWLFQQNCDAVICLGCVIQGDTPHFNYVCNFVTQGILEVGLKHNLPCIFGILTVHNKEQALQRSSGTEGNKGAEAAETALWMIGMAQKCKI